MLTYFQAILLGALQGITELFPVSSLGHVVIIPALFGWHNLVAAESAPESYYLAFVVVLHVGTALGLFVYFRDEWLRIIPAFFKTLSTRRIETPDQRMAWLLGIATVPIGITGLALERVLREHFLKPLPASIFLTANGVILLLGEQVRRRAKARASTLAPSGTQPAAGGRKGERPGRRLDTLNFREALVIGVAETFALFAGISRSGITMVVGLARGLNYEDAARFSFLLATPVILLAGLVKIPDLVGPLGDHVRMPAIVGGLFAAVTAYLSTRFLVRFFQTKNLAPFGIYCLVAGALCILRFV